MSMFTSALISFASVVAHHVFHESMMDNRIEKEFNLFDRTDAVDALHFEAKYKVDNNKRDIFIFRFVLSVP